MRDYHGKWEKLRSSTAELFDFTKLVVSEDPDNLETDADIGRQLADLQKAFAAL